jgi:hypothetical protein
LRPAGHCPQPSPQSSKTAAGAPFWVTLWCSCGKWPADSRNPTRASPVLETSSSAESYKCMPSKVTATTAFAPSTTAAFVSEWGSQFAPCRPLPPAKPTEFQSGGRSPVLGNAVVQLRNMAGRLAEPHSCKPCAGNIKQCRELSDQPLTSTDAPGPLSQDPHSPPGLTVSLLVHPQSGTCTRPS